MKTFIEKATSIFDMGDMYTPTHKHGNRNAALYKLVWNVKKKIEKPLNIGM